MSEIDDIFAKRPVASTSALVPPKKKKTKDKQPPQPSATPSSSKKRPAPETIVDPSTRVPPQKRIKTDKPPPPASSTSTKEDTERFKDSRGSGPRRKTEEGWSIYKEDELGIGDAGGDTPLCPFDCDCCF
ncbi:hypothetical protein B0H17DRAFT_1037010 [Mycena rosella]|uniref:DUF1764-domain-containing protein n=1 Tax=Mycena rosella TaxID=1033263 RepID=A0AAD7GVQ1_MYCRO|nr:hypothetical protein B0H17DRAFT_1037010 [Mycena rosella]